MKHVSVGIDHLAVSGLPAGPRHGAAIGRGIESALGQILAERGLEGRAERDVQGVSIRALRLPPGASDRQIAEAVAMAVHRIMNDTCAARTREK